MRGKVFCILGVSLFALVGAHADERPTSARPSPLQRDRETLAGKWALTPRDQGQGNTIRLWIEVPANRDKLLVIIHESQPGGFRRTEINREFKLEDREDRREIVLPDGYRTVIVAPGHANTENVATRVTYQFVGDGLKLQGSLNRNFEFPVTGMEMRLDLTGDWTRTVTGARSNPFFQDPPAPSEIRPGAPKEGSIPVMPAKPEPRIFPWAVAVLGCLAGVVALIYAARKYRQRTCAKQGDIVAAATKPVTSIDLDRSANRVFTWRIVRWLERVSPRRIVVVAFALACACLLLPVPYYVSGYRPARDKYQQRWSELIRLSEEHVEFRNREFRLTAERKRALREGREPNAAELQAQEVEARRLAEEAEARRDRFASDLKANEGHEAASASATAEWLAIISGLGLLLSLTAGLVVLLGSGIRMGLVTGLAVGALTGASVYNVWQWLLIPSTDEVNYVMMPVVVGAVGLVLGLFCGWVTRFGKRSRPV